MNVICEVTKDNFPQKIVSSDVVVLCDKDKRSRTKVFICDQGRVYAGRDLAKYLGLAHDGLTRRERDYGISHKYFLMERIPDIERKKRNGRPPEDYEAANELLRLSSASRSHNLAKIKTGTAPFDSLIKSRPVKDPNVTISEILGNQAAGNSGPSA